MGNWNETKLEKLLTQKKRQILIDTDSEYSLVTISNKGEVKLREVKSGATISAQKGYIAKAGDFIYSRLSVHTGAFGIVPEELDNALITNEMPCFEIDQSIILPEILIKMIGLPDFLWQLKQLTKGMGRVRIKESMMLSLSLLLPGIDEQRAIVKFFKSVETEDAELKTELSHQQTLLKKLRQQILQEAIEGKLTADLPGRQAGWRDKAFKNYSDKWVPKQSKSYFAYVLECEDGTLYKGFTQNLFDRINRHLEGRGAKKTQQSKPIRLIHFEEFSTEQEAVEREKYFKSGSGREWLNSVLQERIKENEPASELLKRIQAEKAQLIKEKKIKKQKPLPPTRLPDGQVSEDEKPFALPEGWVWCRLRDLSKQYVDCPHDTPKYQGKGFLCLRAPDITENGLLIKTIRRVSKEEYDKRIRRLKPVRNDLVYIREGGRLGIAGLIDTDEPVCLGQRVMLLRFLNEATAKYSLRFLNAPDTYNDIVGKTIGSASPHVNVRDIIAHVVPVPPLPEQKAIVTKVEKLLTLCDQLESQITRNQSHAEQLMQAVLKEAFLPRRQAGNQDTTQTDLPVRQAGAVAANA